jgi:RimJ/RimL family protein N-acetyltransferase
MRLTDALAERVYNGRTIFLWQPQRRFSLIQPPSNLVVREANPGRDFHVLAALMSEGLNRPVSEVELREWDARRASGMFVRRFVADVAEVTVAYGMTAHQTWEPPGRFHVWATTTGSHRGRGVGATMYETALACALENGATLLTSEVRDGDAPSLRFAQKRGFRIDRHLFESHLELAAFDERPFAQVVQSVEATGIRFFSLAEQDTPQTRRGLYEVNRATALDIPGYVGEFSTPEEFEQTVFHAHWFLPEGQILAADGDRIVGLTALGYYPDKGHMVNHMTGVLREYRGRDIALALKLLAIRAARARAVRYLRTQNDSENAPMLAINRKLGYRPEMGVYALIREVEPEEPQR